MNKNLTLVFSFFVTAGNFFVPVRIRYLSRWNQFDKNKLAIELYKTNIFPYSTSIMECKLFCPNRTERQPDADIARLAR
jgi:hypothetical protein